jgi:hypothetical protein
LSSLAACSGGGGDDAAGNAAPPAATASTEGLWQGTIRSSVTNQQHGVSILVLPSGETRLVADNCEQIIAQTSITGQFFSGAGNGYLPDGSLAPCPIALKFPDGTALATASASGQVATRQTLIGTYSAGGDNGIFNTTYNIAYGRPGTLARITGNYDNGTVQITVDSAGVVSGALGSFMLTGRVSTIDPTKNAYRISLTESTVTIDTSTTPPTSVSTVENTFSGTAVLTDYTSGSDNLLSISLTNQKSGFATSLVRQ